MGTFCAALYETHAFALDKTDACCGQTCRQLPLHNARYNTYHPPHARFLYSLPTFPFLDLY